MATETRTRKPAPRRNKRSKWLVRLGIPVLLLGGVFYFFVGADDAELSAGTTFTVTSGPLEVTVLEGGSVEAAQSQEIKNEVEGDTKILSIVEEGTLITAQDVADGKILFELDSKNLTDELVEEKLEFQNASASFTEAKEEYGIQINQNESDVKAAELAMKFARMDLEKFLGVELAGKIIATVETRPDQEEPPVQASSEEESDPAQQTEQANVGPIEVESSFISRPAIDFSQYADPELLGDGEARQLIRDLENELVLTEEEVGLATSQLEGTERLYSKDFVTKNDLDNDSMKLKRSEISREAADTSKDLFIKYEFPKQAETLLSAYEESLRALQRARRLAISKLAQAEAKLNSAEARYELQSRQLEELEEQIQKCVIRATKPGLVVYGSGRPSWRDDDRIEEGAAIRERQTIITIPDTTQMNVEISVHESYVKRVTKGLTARVQVDAFPDRALTGTVTSISVLPDSENRWMNPDLKVYKTQVAIDGTHDWLKPGMSAEAEIIIDRIDDAVQVPLQAILMDNGRQVCFVSTLTGVEPRPVKTGEYNDTMIQILEGVSPGDVVLLRAPKKVGSAGEEGEEEEGEEETEEEAKPDGAMMEPPLAQTPAPAPAVEVAS